MTPALSPLNGLRQCSILAVAIIVSWCAIHPAAAFAQTTPPPASGKSDDDAELERLRTLAQASTQPKAGAAANPAATNPAAANPAAAKPAVTPSIPVRPLAKPAAPPPVVAAPVPTATSSPAASTASSAPAGESDLAALLREGPPQPEDKKYRFEYFDTEWKDVITDFGRRAGLPIVGDLGALAGTITYRSPRDFTFDEALYQINDLLLQRPIEKALVRREDLQLTVKRLPDWIRGIPIERMYGSWDAFVAAGLGPHDIATVMYDAVPAGWAPVQIVDRFRTMFPDVFDVNVFGDRIRLAGLVQDMRYFHDVIQHYGRQFPPEQMTRLVETFTLKNIRPSMAKQALISLFPAVAKGAAAPARPGQQPAVGASPEEEIEKRVDYFADDQNNILTVIAVPSRIGEVRRMLAELERLPQLPDRLRKIYTPKHRTPEELMEIVDVLRALERGTPAEQTAPMSGKPSPRNRPGQPQPPPAVGDLGREGLSPQQRLEDFELVIVPGFRNLLITGFQPGLEKAEQLLAVADVPVERPDQTTVRIKHRSLDDIEAMLAQMFPDMIGRAAPAPTARPPAGPQQSTNAAPRTTLIKDVATSSLILIGRQFDIDQLVRFIESVDQPLPQKERFYIPKVRKPTELAELMGRVIGTGVAPAVQAGPGGELKRATPRGGRGDADARFIGDDATGQLVIYCDEQDWTRFSELLAQFDIEDAILHVFPLKHADADEMVTLLPSLTGEGSRRSSRPIGQAATQLPGGMPSGVAFMADTRTNSVMAYASPREIEPIRKLIESLDIESPFKVTPIKLQHADAADVAESLTSVYQTRRDLRRSVIDGGSRRSRPLGPPVGEAPAAARTGQDVRIVAVPITNTLLVTAGPQDTEEIRQLALSMDAAGKPELIPLKFADASSVAQMLSQTVGAAVGAPRVAGERGLAPRRSDADVRVVPDSFTNSLIVIAPEHELARIRTLVERVDTRDASLMHTVALRFAPAAETASHLMGIFGRGGAAAAASGGPGGAGAARTGFEAVSISPEPLTNSLVIKADRSAYEQIAAMIASIDVEEIHKPTYVKLKFARAEDLVQRLRELFGTSAAAAAPAAPGKGRAVNEMTSVSIDAEPVTNQLMIRAPRSDLGRILEVVQLMDSEQVARKRLVFTVQNRPAEEVARTLREVFARSRSGLKPGPRNVAQAVQTAVTGDSDALGVIVSGDQIILDGPQKDLLDAFEMANRLDRLPQAETIKVYAVTDAEQTAAALKALLAGAAGGGVLKPGETDAGIPLGGGGKPQAGADALTLQDIKVYADTYRSMVFVSAAAAKIPLVDKLIAQIEDPTPAGGETDAVETVGDMNIYELKHREAYDIMYDLEDYFGTKKGGPVFKTGPDDYTLLVQCKPRQWPQVQQIVKLYDRAKRTAAIGDVSRSEITPKPGISAAMALNAFQAQFGKPVKIEAVPSTGPEIEEVDLRKPAADAAKPANSDVQPCLLPRTLLHQVGALALIGQTETPPTEVAPGATTEPTTPAATDTASAPAEAERPVLEITFDPVRNKLVARGHPDDVAEFEKWWESWQEDQDVRIITKAYILANTDVAYAGQILEQILNDRPAAPTPVVQQPQQPQPGQPGGQPRGDKGQAPQQPGGAAPGGADAARAAAANRAGQRTATPARVRTVADARAKKLYVKAAETDFTMITELLRSIDVEAVVATQYRVFQLKKLEAAETAEQLRAILFQRSRQQRGAGPNVALQQGQPQGEQPEGQPGQPGQPRPGQENQPGQPGAVSANEETTRITADPQTNSIIAVAETATLDLIAKIIKDLEALSNVKEFKMEIVAIEHVRASDVVQALTPVLRGEQAAQPGGAKGSKGGDNVVLTADPGGNRIVIAGPAEQLTRVKAMIAELDKPGDAAEVVIHQVKGNPREYERTLKEMFVRAGGPGGQGGADLSVTSDEGTNTVIVKASKQLHSKIKEQIDKLDQLAQGQAQLRPIQLTIGDPEKIAQKLEGVFKDRARKGGPQVKITGINETKQLLVQAPEDLFNEIEQHARGMDKQPMDLDIRSFPLKKAQANDAIKRMDELMQKLLAASRLTGGGTDLGIKTFAYTADPVTNSILVTGEPLAFVIAERVINLLDVDPQTPNQKSIQPYLLSRALDANAVVRTIQQNFTNLQPGVDAPSVTFEPNSSTLLVTATLSQHEKIRGLINDLGTEATKVAPKTYYIDLVVARADEVKRTLDEYFRARYESSGRKPGDLVTLTADPNKNVLVMIGTEESHNLAVEMIKKLDVKGDERITRSFPIRFVDPGSIVNIISAQFPPQGRSPNQQVTVGFEWGTSSLVVTASADNMTKVEELVKTVDLEGTSVKKTRFIKLKEARADIVAQVLMQAWQGGQRYNRQGPPVAITADTTNNQILVTANDEDFAKVEQQVKEIDLPGQEMQTKTFVIKYAAPDAIVNIINQQFVNWSKNPNDQVKASYEWGTQSVVVSANARNMAMVEKLVTSVDIEGPGKATRFIRLTDARADIVAQVLNQAWQWGQRQSRQGPAVVIVPDTTNNQLVVTSTAEDFKKVQEQVKEMDIPGQEMQTRTFVIKYAAPDAIVNIINQQFVNQTRNPNEQVKASFEWGTQSVVVSANARNMKLIDALIKSVDVESAQDQQRVVLEVTNSDARDVAQALNTIYGQRQRTRTGASPATFSPVPNTNQIVIAARTEELKEIRELVKQLDGKPGFNGRVAHVITTLPEHVKSKDISAAINKLYVKPGSDSIKSEFNESTNTLIVFANEAEYAMVDAQIIQPLSKVPNIAELEVYQIPLKHAAAEEVGRTLNDFFREKRGQSRNNFFGGGPNQQLADTTTITAETQSNTLIVACTPKTKKLIDELLVTIDTDVPPGGAREMRMFVLKYMDAADMLKILQEFLKVNRREQEDPNAGLPWWMREGQTKKDDKVVLAGDARLTSVDSQNSIIVVAKKETLDDVAKKIEELDVPNATAQIQPKRIELKHVNPSQLEATLNKLYVQNAPKTKGADYIPTTIVADDTSRSILVSGKPSIVAQIEETVRSLDTPEAMGEGGEIRLVQVPMGMDIKTLGRDLEKLINESEQNRARNFKGYTPQLVAIATDLRTNCLLVTGSRSKHETIKALIEQFAVLRPPTGQRAAIFRPRNISAQDAAKVITEMQRARTSGGRSDAAWPRDGHLPGGAGKRWLDTLPAGISEPRRVSERREGSCIKMGNGYALRAEPIAEILNKYINQARRNPAVASNSDTSEPRSVRITEPRRVSERCEAPRTEWPLGSARATAADFSVASPRAAALNLLAASVIAQTAPAPDAPQPVMIRPLQPPQAAATPETTTAASTSPASQPVTEDLGLTGVELSGAPLTVQVVGDSLLLIGSDDDVALVQRLLSIADEGANRTMEFVKLSNAKAADLAKNVTDVFAKLTGRSGQQPKLEDKVEIVADTRSNSLIVVSSDKWKSSVLNLIKQADETSSLTISSIRNFPLANRLAKDVKPVLEQIVTNWLKQKGADTSAVTVTVDEVTNSIFVTAGEKDLTELENIIKVIDAKPGEEQQKSGLAGTANIMLYPLRLAKADALATLLNKMLEDAKSGKTPLGHVIRKLNVVDDSGNPIVELDLNQPVFAVGDPEANMLIMAGPVNVLKIMRAVVQKFDVAPLRMAVEIRIRNLAHADVAEIADSLTKMLEQGKKLTAPPSEGNAQKGVPEGGEGLAYNAVLNPDPRTNTLFFAGTAEAVKLIDQYLDEIDQPGVPLMPVELIVLKHAGASELETIVSDLMKQRAETLPVGKGGNAEKRNKVVIKADARSNTLLVACVPDTMEIVRKIVQSLDQEFAFEGATELFVLRHTGAAKVKEALDGLFEKGVFRPGQPIDEKNEAAKSRNKVTVIADDRSNAVVVSASPENMSIVKKIVSQMDAPLPWTPAATQIFELVHADAVKVAAILKDYFEKLKEAESTGDRKNVFVPVNIFADERTNRLIVSAANDGLDKARSIIVQLDVPPGSPSSEIKVYPLRENSAAKLAPIVQELFKERKTPRGDDSKVPEIPMAIKPDELSNSLVVTASRDDHALLESLLRKLDVPSDLISKVRLFPLKRAGAKAAKEALEELYKGITAGGSGGNSGPPFSVAVDERINALIVFAPPGEMASIARLIEQIDTTDPGMSLVVRVFPLENADAKKTSELLNDIMSGKVAEGGGTDENKSSPLIAYFDKDPYGKELFLKTIRENAKVWSDERTNAVLVMAPQTGVDLIGALIIKLDTIKKREVLVKAFTLRNADAEATVELLESIFAQDEQAQQQEEFQQGRELSVSGGSTSAAATPAAFSQTGSSSKGTFGKPRATFTPDKRTNSVIVAGWPEDIQVASDVISQLDSQSIQERVHLVYTCQNTKAPELQTALQEFYSNEVERLGEGGQEVSEQVRQAEDVSVVAHEESNQLVISVAPRKLSQVEQIVRQLDTPPAQVMIQVLLAEVNLDDTSEFGLEYSLQDLRFSENAVVGPNGTLQGGNFDFVGGVDLGAAGSGGLGGFTFTITGEDFGFLVRALQSTGKLQILQRPSIMVQDNQTANITVGQQVPLVSGSQTTDAGNAIATIDYQDVGVILEVTPNINPDGWVYMEVKPEISSITDSSVPIGNGINAPIIREQSAETTVVVKDGETVIIGGLIVDSVRSSENKIPILGELPGSEFFGLKTVRDVRNRSELMIVLTPRVIRTVEDARTLSIDERDRSKITPAMKSSDMMERLRVVPEEGDEVAPPEDVFGTPLPIVDALQFDEEPFALPTRTTPAANGGSKSNGAARTNGAASRARPAAVAAEPVYGPIFDLPSVELPAASPGVAPAMDTTLLLPAVAAEPAGK